MPCAVVAAWYSRRASNGLLSVLSMALIVLLFAAAYTTFNRTIWVGFAGQFLLIGALLAMRNEHVIASRAKMVGTALAILIVAGAALMTFQAHEARQQYSETALDKDSRLKLWPEVLEYVKERPLTGYGFGRGMLRESLLKEFQHTFLWHAHNLFLDSVLQGGLPGLLLLLFLLGATLRQGWRMSRSSDDLAAACGLAVLAVVAGMIIRNMTDTLWVRQNALLYWSLLGVLFAWGRATPTRVSP
jgi:O-antigen ligase